MALVDCPEVCIGFQGLVDDGARTQVLDADIEAVGFIVMAPKSGDISDVHFYTATVTTGDTMLVSLQTVDVTDGNPDGTIDQSGTVVVGDGDDNVRKTVALGSNRTVTKGEYIAIVIEFDSFVAGNMQIRIGDDSYGREITYSKFRDTGSSWSALFARRPILLLEYSDGSFPYPVDCLPASPTQYSGLDSGDTPDEVALRFKLTGPMRLSGAEWFGDLANAALPELVIYEGTTALGTISNIDGDIKRNTSNGRYRGVFSSGVVLSAGTVYRLGLRPTTTATVGLHRLIVDSNDHLEATPGGKEFYTSTRVDQGAWDADLTTTQVAINLYFDQIDDGAGGGDTVVISRPRRII